MVDKYGIEEKEKKTAKAVRILKAAFRKLNVAVKWSIPRIKTAYKWTKGKTSMKQLIKWGMILLIIGVMVQSWIFGSSIPVVNAALKSYFSRLI